MVKLLNEFYICVSTNQPAGYNDNDEGDLRLSCSLRSDLNSAYGDGRVKRFDESACNSLLHANPSYSTTYCIPQCMRWQLAWHRCACCPAAPMHALCNITSCLLGILITAQNRCVYDPLLLAFPLPLFLSLFEQNTLSSPDEQTHPCTISTARLML